jgi:hypothetical protein
VEQDTVSITLHPLGEAARPAAPELADHIGKRRPVGPDEFDIEAPARETQIARDRPELAAVAVDERRDD